MDNKMKTIVYKNYRDFRTREDKTSNGVSEGFALEFANYEEMNSTNKGCWNCIDCTDCIDCAGCFDCTYCTKCVECFECTKCTKCADCFECTECTDC